MGVTAKRTLAVTVGALGMVLVAMSVAWACSANRHMEASANEVMPGMPVTVSNVQWVANGHTAFTGPQVEVRWAAKSTAYQPHNVTGRTQLLATAPVSNEGTFTATVTVPEGIAGGDYVLLAVGPEEYPTRDIASIPIRVIGGTQPETVGQTPPVSQPAPVENPTPVENPAPVEDTTPDPAPAAPAPAPVAPAPVAPAPAPVAQAPTSAAPAPAPAATIPVRELVNANVATQPEAQVPAALTNSVADAAPSDRAVPAALTNGYVAPTSEAPVQASSPVPNAAETPSDATAPTSGFTSPERSGYEWAAAPETSGANRGVGAGLALLSGGMVLLLAGFTLATLSRRREKAKVTGR